MGKITRQELSSGVVSELDRSSLLTTLLTAAGTNTYTLTSSTITSYFTGLKVSVLFTNANTGVATLNINSLGAKPIVKAGGAALSAGNLKAGGVYSLVYDGVNFQLQGEGGEYGTATASDVLAGKNNRN